MSTKIAWTSETWNPTVGCSQASDECRSCYAIGVAHRGLTPAHRGLTVMTDHGADWTGEVRCLPERLKVPFGWRKPRRVFVDSMSDLFHPNVPDEFIDRVFAVMALTPLHTYQLLTKRPQRMRSYLDDTTANGSVRSGLVYEAMDSEIAYDDHPLAYPTWPLRNVWAGASIGRDKFSFRAEHVRATDISVRFLSLEPLLEPLPTLRLDGIDWAIVGGESGPGARPMRAEWAANLRDRCADAGVAFFFKQAGAVLAKEWGMKGAGHDVEEMPEDFRVQQYPDER